MSEPVQNISQQQNNAVQDTTLNPDEDNKNTIMYYVIISVVVIVVIYAIWFSYGKFKENSSKDGFIKNLQQERSDTEVDFNIADAIDELNRLQEGYIKKLSSDVGF